MSLCLEKRRAGGGIGGRAQRLPQSRMTILILTSNPTCKNAAPPPKQNDNTYFHKQGYKQNISIYLYIYLPIYWCVYIYIYIGEFNASVSLCLEKKKSGRGDWGEGAAPPPKAEWQYLMSQARLQAKTSVYIYLYIYIYISIYLSLFISLFLFIYLFILYIYI